LPALVVAGAPPVASTSWKLLSSPRTIVHPIVPARSETTAMPIPLSRDILPSVHPPAPRFTHWEAARRCSIHMQMKSAWHTPLWQSLLT
jgi:hypothetical protein